MILYKSKEKCCACTACINICPKGAIEMKEDEQGFLYPEINNDKCIECGLCNKVCAFQNGYERNNYLKVPDVYGVKHKNEEVRLNSSSGGIFTAITDYILEQDGSIYGADFDDNFVVCHRRAITKEQRDRFRGSKYVQSDLGQVFKEVKEDLKNDKYVLFTGTSCQVAGLKKYLGKDYEKLYLQDIVCHGTPSPKVWKDYIKYFENKYGSKVVEYKFRNKEKFWRGYNIYIKFDNGKIIRNTSESMAYVKIFGDDVALRKSCFNCKYSTIHKPSDITIGDFWGIEKSSICNFEDAKGVSLVLINTEKGRELFNKVKDSIEYRVSNEKECLQLNLQRPSIKPKEYDMFWSDYKEKDIKYIFKRYGGNNIKYKTKSCIIKGLKKTGLLNIFRKILKRV